MDYLLKPIEEDDLKRCLQKWLDKFKGESDHQKLDADKTEFTDCTMDQVVAYMENTPLGQITLAYFSNNFKN